MDIIHKSLIHQSLLPNYYIIYLGLNLNNLFNDQLITYSNSFTLESFINVID